MTRSPKVGSWVWVGFQYRNRLEQMRVVKCKGRMISLKDKEGNVDLFQLPITWIATSLKGLIPSLVERNRFFTEIVYTSNGFMRPELMKK